MPRLKIYLFTAIIGLMAMVTQLSLIRLLSLTFYGNELSFCLAIGNWLLWTGLGSLSGRYLLIKGAARRSLQILAAVEVLIIIVTIYGLSLSRFILGLSPSEIIGILPIWFWSLILFLLPGWLNGLFFPLLVQWHSRQLPEYSIRIIYVMEAVGAVIGTLGFALLVYLRLTTFTILHGTVLLLIVVTALVLIERWSLKLLYVGIFGIFVVVSLWLGVPALLKKKWQPFKVIEFTESPYQAFTWLSYADNQILYGDSEPLWVIGDRQKAEEIVHFGLLNHSAPQRILLIGMFTPDILREIEKYRTVEVILNLQPDRVLVELTERFFAEIHSPVQWRMAVVDPLEYLRRSNELFDVILLNVPLPVSANWNRYYTLEFYQLLKRHLSQGGLISLALPGDEEYFTAEQRAFLKTVDNTVDQVFGRKTWIPGATLHLIAGDTVFNNDYFFFDQQLKQRDIETSYIHGRFLFDRLAPARLRFIESQLSEVPDGFTNRLARPVGFYFDTVLWDQRTGGFFKGIYVALARLNPGYFLAGVLLLFVLVGSFLCSTKRWRLIFTIFGIGCITMCLESVVIIIYQSFVGSLYLHIVFLTLAYMLGSTIGGLCFKPGAHLIAPYKLLRLYILLPCLGWLLLVCHPQAISGAVLCYGLLLLNGFLTGYSFLVLASRVSANAQISVGAIGGICYAADIAGAAGGVYLGTILTIPVYGLKLTLLLILGICLVLLSLNRFKTAI
jgi:predicted membrane-bound spermidine synthase